MERSKYPLKKNNYFIQNPSFGLKDTGKTTKALLSSVSASDWNENNHNANRGLIHQCPYEKRNRRERCRMQSDCDEGCKADEIHVLFRRKEKKTHRRLDWTTEYLIKL